MVLKPDHPKFTVLMANKAYLEATSTTEADLLGIGILEAFPENPGDTATGNVNTLRNALIECLTAKRQTVLPSQRYDIPIRGSSEFETRYWQASNSPIINDDGEVEFIIHIAIDITGAFQLARQERVAFEVAETRRKELHSLFMQAPGAICILRGPEFIFELVNPNYQQIFPGRNLLGKPVLEALPEFKEQKIYQVLKTVYDTGQVYEGNEILTQISRHEGSTPENIYWNFIYQPRYDAENKIDGIIVFAYEVTDLVIARQNIQKNEERLKLAVENAAAGVFDTDLKTGKSIVSLLHSQTFGYDTLQQDWSFERLLEHVIPEDQELAKAGYLQVRTEGALDTVLRIRRLDGALRWISIIGRVHYDSKGEPERIIGTTTDVTDKMEIQRQKDEFISTVSHELKTPVTSIKAYAQVLKKTLGGTENAQNLHFLERMQVQVDRLQFLIQSLLDITRIESGKLTLQPELFAMDKFLVEIVGDLQLITTTHKLIITESSPVQVFADQTRISQVLTNLITNAIKYSPLADKVNISLKQENSVMICCIQDFGVGIPEQEKPYVFGRFHQAEQLNKDSGMSLGLGLYISKEIVNREGGDIWFESEIGKGTTFCFSLPSCI